MAMQDLAWVSIFLVFFGITILVANYIADEAFPKIKEQVGEKGGEMVDAADFAFGVLDYVFLIIAVGMLIGVMVLAWRLNVSPVFMFFGIIILIILTAIITPTMSNVMWNIFNQTQFSQYADDYDIMTFIYENYPLLFAVFGGLLLIVMYARYKSQSGASE